MSENKEELLDKVFANLRKFGLTPIPVQTLNAEAETTRYFGGTFDEFVEAAKLLGAKAVFASPLYLDEDEFYYNGGDQEGEYEEAYDDYDEGEDEPEDAQEEAPEDDVPEVLGPEDLDGLDLSLLRPELAKFEQHIGEVCGVTLTVPGPDHLEVEVFANWYDEFAELVDAASEEIEEDPAKALEVIERRCSEEE